MSRNIWDCQLCGKKHGNLSITIQPEEEGDEQYGYYICDACWDIIAEIARRIYHIEKLKEEQNGQRTN